MNRRIPKEIRALARAHGFHFERWANTAHAMWKHDDGRIVVTSSSGDWRAFHHARADFRRRAQRRKDERATH